MRDLRQTYHEMIIAIALQAVVICTIGAVLTKQYVTFSAGVLFGCAAAVGLLSNMMKSVAVIVELDPERAKRYGIRQSVTRIAVMGLMLCIAVYFEEYINPWGVLLGLAALKFSAYLQGAVHKVIIRIDRKKGRKEK